MIHKQRLNNRILSLVLVLVMVLSMLPMTGLMAHAATVGSTSISPYNGWPEKPTKITSSNYAYFGLTSDNWSTYDGYYGIRNASELYGSDSHVGLFGIVGTYPNVSPRFTIKNVVLANSYFCGYQGCSRCLQRTYRL